MNKKHYFLAALVAVVVTSFILYSKDEPLTTRTLPLPPTDTKVLEEENNEMEQQLMTDEENTTPSKKNELTTINASEIRSFHETFPSEKQVKDDMKSNPHSPSKSLMIFAKKLGPIMEKALKDENNAMVLTRELQVCAHDESVAAAARALCVQDTETLANYHPQIKSKAVELRENMPQEVQKILDTNDAFINK